MATTHDEEFRTPWHLEEFEREATRQVDWERRRHEEVQARYRKWVSEWTAIQHVTPIIVAYMQKAPVERLEFSPAPAPRWTLHYRHPSGGAGSIELRIGLYPPNEVGKLGDRITILAYPGGLTGRDLDNWIQLVRTLSAVTGLPVWDKDQYRPSVFEPH